MPLLALDTATRATAVAWQATAAEPALEARDDPPAGERPRHTTCLLPLIAELLERSGSSWRQLERIAVGVGPGGFTGLRVGIATARALAQALALPLVGVSTLRSMAASVQRADPRVLGAAGRRTETVVAVLDARRGEVFAAAWSTADRGLVPLFGVRALSPAALVDLLVRTEGLAAARTLAVGDGALAFRDVLEPSGVVIPDDNSECHRVTAASHCRLAWSLPAGHPDDVHPCYVRLPDAQPGPRALAPTR
ncbi:MAG: tRNA (adenosine(37)-N6)-threonylcarbamoyltransferase complex dimerization subunit type 1 TsaB [Solirubrobacterales bacterium]|nr:tRNA (adenosine(37)-N6)-threonylcarbamoyltransferase complex dimerization subunit type 1 TsaB [Solirubrobacterales bacterium]MBV9536593.1 tRNA (adenosine(37)-N6)-threonylcarbamoyltransferase complex dimerization subunit type 1 TsaB [Solirubrobacterales bacterium]